MALPILIRCRQSKADTNASIGIGASLNIYYIHASYIIKQQGYVILSCMFMCNLY